MFFFFEFIECRCRAAAAAAPSIADSKDEKESPDAAFDRQLHELEQWLVHNENMPASSGIGSSAAAAASSSPDASPQTLPPVLLKLGHVDRDRFQIFVDLLSTTPSCSPSPTAATAAAAAAGQSDATESVLVPASATASESSPPTEVVDSIMLQLPSPLEPNFSCKTRISHLSREVNRFLTSFRSQVTLNSLLNHIRECLQGSSSSSSSGTFEDFGTQTAAAGLQRSRSSSSSSSSSAKAQPASTIDLDAELAASLNQEEQNDLRRQN